MYNPLTYAYGLHCMFVRSAAHMVEEGYKMTHHDDSHHRKEDAPRPQPIQPETHSADLTHRYGHRAHDVDIEHL